MLLYQSDMQSDTATDSHNVASNMWSHHLANVDKVLWRYGHRQTLSDTFEPCDPDLDVLDPKSVPDQGTPRSLSWRVL